MTFDIKKSVKGVRDHDRYKDDGLYNVERIVVESSNIGTAQIALKNEFFSQSFCLLMILILRPFQFFSVWPFSFWYYRVDRLFYLRS